MLLRNYYSKLLIEWYVECINRTISSNQVSKDNIGVKICKTFWRNGFHDDQIVRDAVVQPVMSTSSFLIFLFWLKDIESPHELGSFGKRFLVTMLLFCENTCGATIFMMTRLLEMLWSSQLWVQVHFLIFLFWLKDIESPHELGPFGKRFLITMLLFCKNTCEWKNI